MARNVQRLKTLNVLDKICFPVKTSYLHLDDQVAMFRPVFQPKWRPNILYRKISEPALMVKRKGRDNQDRWIRLMLKKRLVLKVALVS